MHFLFTTKTPSHKITQSVLSFFVLFVSLCLSGYYLFGLTLTVKAQDSEPTDDEVNAIAKQLYCPVCENTPLDVCPTQACAQWRATIKEKLTAGWTEQQIKDYFVTQYGERVLAQPSTRGFNILLWTLAPAGVLIAVGVFVYYVRRLQKPASAAAPAAGEADEYVKRLEAELAKRR